jgi:FSR family fosmidomycin resistance protein-like MFS transporter
MISTTTLILYGGAHAVVDAACAALVFGLVASHHFDAGMGGVVFVLYNLLAFGLQPLLALAVDRRQCYRQAAVVGCAVTGAAMLLPGSLAMWAVCVAGVGNALFHLGAGSIALRLQPGSAGPAGIFVAPGGVGLFLGIVLGEHGFSAFWTGAVALGALAVLLLVHVVPLPPPREKPEIVCGPGKLILLLLLCSVAMRSLVGLALGVPWRPSPMLATGLVAAAAAGKGLGGVLADRFGWMRVALCAPLAAVPLLLCATSWHAEAVAAMFLVSATMPVALAAVAKSLPREPAFAFGLTAFALLVGGLPALTAAGPLFGLREPLAVAALGCGLALYFGLRLSQTTADRIRTTRDSLPR